MRIGQINYTARNLIRMKKYFGMLVERDMKMYYVHDSILASVTV